MKKVIIIEQDTHQALVTYCDTFGFKIGDKADLIIKEFLLKEAGGEE